MALTVGDSLRNRSCRFFSRVSKDRIDGYAKSKELKHILDSSLSTPASASSDNVARGHDPFAMRR